ncbi:kinesin-like protein Klp61F [Bacillus rossius redtenbacheri]|uniref:kinesin-like protein Klp61F n=1 Tax=Bacillus rossius redtenbacheri TaxID=93214 RepID=UPI002FDCF594
MNSATKSKPARVKEKTHHVQVFVRVRSLGTHDRSRTPHVVHCTSNEVTIKDRQELKVIKTFCFDRVFDQNSTQLEVYNHVVRPAVADILKGYNYTVFAYGQSGSGKSYTVAGGRSLDPDVSWDQDPQCGLVPRVLVHLFDELRLLQAEFTLRISLLELCNEDMTDLLSRSGDSSKLRLYEDCNRKGAVFVHGLEEEVLHTRRDLHNVLLKCAARSSSSRSHTIFTATVHVKENSVEGDELVRTAKLCLVDLAASDQAGPNNSLLNLGRVLTALVERAPHVPYSVPRTSRTGTNNSLLNLGRVLTALVERAPHVPYRYQQLPAEPGPCPHRAGNNNSLLNLGRVLAALVERAPHAPYRYQQLPAEPGPCPHRAGGACPARPVQVPTNQARPNNSLLNLGRVLTALVERTNNSLLNLGRVLTALVERTNNSLLNLGRVLTALVERASHVPYRYQQLPAEPGPCPHRAGGACPPRPVQVPTNQARPNNSLLNLGRVLTALVDRASHVPYRYQQLPAEPGTCPHRAGGACLPRPVQVPTNQASPNNSLLNLGRVLTALVDRASHVPYRYQQLPAEPGTCPHRAGTNNSLLNLGRVLAALVERTNNSLLNLDRVLTALVERSPPRPVQVPTNQARPNNSLLNLGRVLTALVDRASHVPYRYQQLPAEPGTCPHRAGTNNSLLNLGRVLTALVERASHVPYRYQQLPAEPGPCPHRAGGACPPRPVQVPTNQARPNNSLLNLGRTNNSLLNLGRVLTALVERAPHVPYRESKLTRLLRDALCGRSRASIIGCISPAAPHLDDTIGTLEYVHRARSITVRPELNPKVTKQSLIKMYAEEIERLKRDLEACRTRQGVYLVNEDYSQMISDTDRLNREISEKLASIRAFTDQIHEKQRLLEDLSLHLEDVQAQLRDTRGRLRAQLACRDETQLLLDRHRRTRDSLLGQAGELLGTVEETTGHLRALHAKLHRTRDISSKNESQMKQLGEQFSREMQRMAAEVGELVSSFLASAASVRERVGGLLEADMPVSASMRNKLQAMASSHGEAVNHVQAIVQKMATDANTLVERAEKTVLDTADLDAVLRDYQHVVLPLVQHVCARLQSCSVSGLDALALLQSKNQKETTWMAESWNSQNESALRLQKEFLEEFEKRHLEKQRMWVLIHDLNERQRQSKAELLARTGEMRAALHGCAARGQEYHRVLAQASAERRREAQGCADADRCLSDHLDLQRESDGRLWTDMKACNRQLLADLRGALQQARAVTEEVSAGQAVAHGHAAGLAGAGTAAWARRAKQTRTSVGAVSAALSADLREAEGVSGRACEATAALARSVAAQVEQLQEQTRAGSLGLLQQVECSAVPLAAWPARATAGLQWAAAQVSSIAEDHVEYQPSGNTPERKEYEYPKALEATSPHDSILEQFRATRNNLQSSPDFLDSTCEEEQVLPSEGNKSQVLPSTSSPNDGETSSQSETSSTAAVTGSDVDVSDMMAEDKENAVWSAAQCVSKLPVKMASGNADPCKKVLFPRN